MHDLAVSLVITAALFLVGEAVARLFGTSGYFLVPGQNNCLRLSASLGMEFRPECAATWREFLLTGKQETTFTTNRLGLRDAEVSDDGAARILALGDSCTWGWQVEQSAAYPQALQHLIDGKEGPGNIASSTPARLGTRAIRASSICASAAWS